MDWREPQPHGVAVFRGSLTRRALNASVTAGLVVGGFASMLAACRATESSTPIPPRPTDRPPAAEPLARPTAVTPAVSSGRGSSGTLKILMSQGATILNPHLAQGNKDQVASRLFCEPLLTVSGDGKFSPVLADEVPSRENGGLEADGKTVTYRLRKDVKWADGKPFTAEDVIFTYQYVTNRATAAPSLAVYLGLERVEAIDPLTVRLTFQQPTGGWYVPFTGAYGSILPRHALQGYVGAEARNAPFNLKAFGTGPFMVEDFKPGDLLTMTANPNYREPNKPSFSRLEIKGGGDIVSAARAVLQTGEYDYASGVNGVEGQILAQLAQGGKGDLAISPGSVEQIFFNMADPNVEIDGERSSPKSKHPFLTDQRVRQSMALAIDRIGLARQLYGETAQATANVLTTPTNLNSNNTSFEFNIDMANQILDQAGYPRGVDGIRVTPSGVRMHVLFQTTVNSLRQKEQALVKDGWQKIGVETELKAIDASAFLSDDPGNPDTNWHFYADVEMTSVPFDSPFPLRYMRGFYAAVQERDWAQKSNKWAGPNFQKWSSDEYDKLYDQAAIETDPDRARQMWIRLNDLVVNSYVRVALVDRKSIDARSKTLRGPDPRSFDGGFAWNVADWTRV
jgi:peptide/nickel transport system substrate-binding protein